MPQCVDTDSSRAVVEKGRFRVVTNIILSFGTSRERDVKQRSVMARSEWGRGWSITAHYFPNI